MKYYIFAMDNEKLGDIFQSSFDSVVYDTKKEAKKAAKKYFRWTKKNSTGETGYKIYEMKFTEVK